MSPVLSIVIANYNYGRFLESAIRSVIDQDSFSRCELIVVDGGSSDESIEVITRYANQLAWWVSEPDTGQSDAFNKGFSHARGKYLTWLNADDIMIPGCLTKVIACMREHPDCEWFTANSFDFLSDGKFCRLVWGPHVFPAVLQRRNSPTIAFGPTTFFSKKILSQVGGIDEALHFVMDTDLWKRFIMAGVKQRRINTFCWGFRAHEASKTAQFQNHKLDAKRQKAIRQETDLSNAKIGYKMSRLNHLLICLLRIIDGSFIRGRIMSWRLKGVNMLKRYGIK